MLLNTLHHLVALLAASGTAAAPSALFVYQSPGKPARIHANFAKTSPTIEEIEQESEVLRAEIKELKSEALRRLRALEETLGVAPSAPSNKQTESSLIVDANESELLPPPSPFVIKNTKKKNVDDLLDESTWKVSLSE